jgi:hypothetical protein
MVVAVGTFSRLASDCNNNVGIFSNNNHKNTVNGNVLLHNDNDCRLCDVEATPAGNVEARASAPAVSVANAAQPNEQLTTAKIR